MVHFSQLVNIGLTLLLFSSDSQMLGSLELCLFLWLAFFKWFQTVFWNMGNRYSVHRTVFLNDFRYRIGSFHKRPFKTWWITGMKSRKSKLSMIGCYRIRTLTTFSATWLAFSPLLKKNCKKLRIFSLMVFMFNICSNKAERTNQKSNSKIFFLSWLILHWLNKPRYRIL